MHFRRFRYIHIACILWDIFSLPAVSSIHTDLPLKEVLCSGAGKLVKWRLASTHPGSGSDSGRRKHSQTGLSHPSPVPWLSCQAPWGRAGSQEPPGRGAGGERRGGRAGRRSGDTARPAEGRHSGKGLAPVAPQRLRLGASSRPGVSGTSGRAGPVSAASGLQGSAHPSGAPRPEGGEQGCRRGGAGSSAVPRGWEARRRPRLGTLERAGAWAGPGRAGNWTGALAARRARVGRGRSRRPRHPPAAEAPLSRGPSLSGERGAASSIAGRPGGAGAGLTLRGGKPATRSQQTQTRKGSHSDLQARDPRGSGVRGLRPPRVGSHRNRRRLHVPASQRGLWSPQCVSRAAPGLRTAPTFLVMAGRMGRGSGRSGT